MSRLHIICINCVRIMLVPGCWQSMWSHLLRYQWNFHNHPRHASKIYASKLCKAQQGLFWYTYRHASSVHSESVPWWNGQHWPHSQPISIDSSPCIELLYIYSVPNWCYHFPYRECRRGTQAKFLAMGHLPMCSYTSCLIIYRINIIHRFNAL